MERSEAARFFCLTVVGVLNIFQAAEGTFHLEKVALVHRKFQFVQAEVGEEFHTHERLPPSDEDFKAQCKNLSDFHKKKFVFALKFFTTLSQRFHYCLRKNR